MSSAVDSIRSLKSSKFAAPPPGKPRGCCPLSLSTCVSLWDLEEGLQRARKQRTATLIALGKHGDIWVVDSPTETPHLECHPPWSPHQRKESKRSYWWCCMHCAVSWGSKKRLEKEKRGERNSPRTPMSRSVNSRSLSAAFSSSSGINLLLVVWHVRSVWMWWDRARGSRTRDYGQLKEGCSNAHVWVMQCKSRCLPCLV